METFNSLEISARVAATSFIPATCWLTSLVERDISFVAA